MSHDSKNSVRDKVIGKKWIYLERSTLHRQSVAISEGESGMGLSVFIGVGKFFFFLRFFSPFLFLIN